MATTRGIEGPIEPADEEASQLAPRPHFRCRREAEGEEMEQRQRQEVLDRIDT